jgi:DNA-binding MarR family transcriptional regulator
MRETSKSHELANEISIMAVRLIRWLRAADNDAVLTGPQASAMAVIVHSGGISPSALAEMEQVKRPSITRVADELVKLGLVKREPHPIDKRGAILLATAEGLALWQSGQLRATAPLAARIKALSPKERRQLDLAMPLLGQLMEPPEI